MIPKLSAPLVKDIRTGEGILEWLLAAGVTAAGATSNLSVSHTATYVAIVAGIKGARRVVLKVVALTRPVLGEPIAPQWSTLNAGVAGTSNARQVSLFPTPQPAEPAPLAWEPEHALTPEPAAIPDPAVPA